MTALRRQRRCGVVAGLRAVVAGARAVVLVGFALASTGPVLGGCFGPEADVGQERRGERAVPVRAEAVTRGAIEIAERFSGELWADAVDLAPNVSGVLAAVGPRLGDRVEKGAVVARLDTRELARQKEAAAAAAKASLAEARIADASLATVRAELERKRPLAAERLISAQELADLEGRARSLEAELAASEASAVAAGARARLVDEQLRSAQLVAPFAGRVAERRLEPGAMAGPGASVVRLVADGPLRVRFRVPESRLGQLRVGSPLEVRTAAGPRAFGGEVERIGAEVSRADRSVPVEGVLRDHDDALKAGMYATVDVRFEKLDDVLLIPAAALLSRAIEQVESAGVFKAELGADASLARWVPATVLGRSRDRVAVEADLAPGDLVLTLGHEEVAPGTAIDVQKAAPSAAGPPAGGAEG